MANSLERKLNNILNIKNVKIIPENIKKDVSIFDVTGTLESAIITDKEYNQCLDYTNKILTHDEYVPYTKLDYIETSYTQWIDTGIMANSDIVIEMNFKNLHSGSNRSYDRIIGTTQDVNFEFCDMGSVEYYRASINPSNIMENLTLNADEYNTIKLTGDGKVLINDIQKSSFSANPLNLPIQLFTINSHNNGDGCAIKMKYCKIYKDNNLIRDFIPTKDEDNVVCLYDKVSMEFFYNSGTGEFIGGNEI
ncbi:MAG: hypothetical protein MR384_13425 [Lachnospiraceae bacterium]|nr:hypothetical protein [Lachnospiraceae bacterium]